MKTTFSRYFFSAAIVLLAALLLVGASFRTLVGDYLEDHALEELKGNATALSSLASAYYSEGSITDRDFLVNLSVASRVSDTDVVICDAEGRLQLCSDAPLGCKQHRGLRLSSRGFLERILQDGCASGSGLIGSLYADERYFVAVPIMDTASRAIGFVLVSQPTESTMLVLKKITDIYLFVAMLVILVSVVIMTVLTRRESRPLQQMAKTANDFGHGNLDARVNLEDGYSREVQELALAFNNMASSLQKSEYRRQEFVANVSHELKTPMTVIGGYIDGILDGTIPPEKQEHYMRIVSDEIRRLSRLVRSMLDISRLQDQHGIPEEKKVRFDLEACAGEVLVTFEQKILSRRCNVEVDMPEHPVYTIAEKDAITQVIYNLLDNAVKFCPAEGTLGLRIREGGSKVYVSVFNDGQTIPPEELPLVFDRFHKIDKSRSENRDGWGLGLYIVKTLICSHGEDISVTSLDGRTEFTFTLPLVN